MMVQDNERNILGEQKRIKDFEPPAEYAHYLARDQRCSIGS